MSLNSYKMILHRDGSPVTCPQCHRFVLSRDFDMATPGGWSCNGRVRFRLGRDGALTKDPLGPQLCK